MCNLKIDRFKMKYFNSVRKIYKSSFPRSERFPFIILLLNIIRGNSSMNVLIDNNIIYGFIYYINYKEMSFILYLAINKNIRNKGYGSYLLKWLQNKKHNIDVYLNIDEINSIYKDNDVRIKRLNFYLNNNFYLTNYVSVEHSGNFNILTTNKEFNINEYIKLDKKISFWFFNKKSKIVDKRYI